MNKFTSRKFWMAVAMPILIILNHIFDFGLNDKQIAEIIAILGAFILGESYIDGKRLSNGK